jgi:hypothetical protein
MHPSLTTAFYLKKKKLKERQKKKEEGKSMRKSCGK